MRGVIRPILIEDKIAKRIKDGAVFVNFRLLPNMRVVTVNNIGSPINKLMSKINFPSFGARQVFCPPVKRDN